MIPRQRCRNINRPIWLGLSIGRLIIGSVLGGRSCGGAFDLAELFFVVTDAGGDGFERGAQRCDVGGESGDGGGAGCLAALFLDYCTHCGVPVEAGPADASLHGDGGEGDGPAGCSQFGAGLLGQVQVIAAHPAWALLIRSSRRVMSLWCRLASLIQPRASASAASCSASAFCAARTGRYPVSVRKFGQCSQMLA